MPVYTPPRVPLPQPGGIPQPYNVAGLYGIPDLSAPVPQPVYMQEGGEVEKPNMRQEFMEEAARRINAGGITGWIPNPINSLKALANMRFPTTANEKNYPSPDRPGSPGYQPSPVPRSAFGGPGIPFSQAGNIEGYGRMTTTGFDPTAGGTYDPGSQITGYSEGGSPKNTRFPRKTGAINGPGTGTSDSIPAMLSDGEFVFTAKAVRNAGGGSRRKGAKRMYNLMKKLEGGVVQG
jgi:hypothetical protein